MICPVCNHDVEVAQERFTIHGDCPGGFAYTELAETNLESRYTDPRPDCPHPERWHSDDWDSAEREVSRLVAAFVAALRPDWVLETGTAYGQTAEAIGKVLQRAGVGHLATYEIDPERAAMAEKRCEGLPVTVVCKSSLDATIAEPPDADFGVAWFDSLPSLRVKEFRYFYPVLAPGAIVGFHDTAPHHGADLWADILRLEGEGLLLPIRLRTPRGVVFGEVVKGG